MNKSSNTLILAKLCDKKLALFLDFDGTLTEVHADPGKTQLSLEVKEILERLSENFPVSIVSGRALDDLRQKVSIPSLTYVGNHGMQIFGLEETFVYDIGSKAKEALNEASGILFKIANSRPGLVLEDKKFSLSLHFKGLNNRDESLLKAEINGLLADLLKSGLLRITGGKKICEVRTRHHWNKGDAVSWLLGRKAFIGRYPVYIGDDLTDADAFEALQGIGTSISVGRQDLGADYSLNGVDAVLSTLASLATIKVRDL